jgi:hypothetical protein
LIDDVRRYGAAAFFRRLISRNARIEAEIAEELPTVSQ